ncbi:MAG TPA: LLM class flavin-dependent oxidoreductase [Acidimicrobiales bacterium]|nr:LLM class flavin-dependent oxidoreductase [Acidimicrobiales bacterium]
MTETGAFLSLRYDLRAPAFGTPAEALYRAALEQCAWAEDNGFLMATLSEHHGSDDGYCPSPLVMAAAIAGRTRNLRILVAALIVPLYDPIRLAEDLAVLDLASGGRTDIILGAGYRPEELAMFGHDMDERVPLLEEGIAVLRSAWSGEEFEYRGRRVRVTPRPARPDGPGLLMGGSSPAAARRAARLGLGFVPVDESLWPPYADACREHGREAGSAPALNGPRFIHIADDPDEAWARIAPHALHETNSYGAWLSSADALGPYRTTDDVDSLRASGEYLVLTPDECVARVRETRSLLLHPLMGGLHPDLAWESLELVASKVIPRLAQPA